MTESSEVVVSPEMHRAGLAPAVIRGIQEIDLLVRDMRDGITWPSTEWDEETAVRFYLLYLSMLVDTMLAEVAISAIAGNDIAVIMKRRLLIEYGVRGAYCNDHPEYALYIVTVGRAKEVLRRLRLIKSEPAVISAATKALDEARKRFPSVSELSKMQFTDMMVEYGDKKDYIAHYGSPSTLLHGDPEGINAITDGSGQPRLTFEPERANAMLVDVGRDAIFFCKHFISRFHPESPAFAARVEELESRFVRLILSNTYGRDEADLVALRLELGE